MSGFDAGAAEGFLQIRNGYFWDPQARQCFIPRGFGYQTFNPPVGANQSPAQLDYDLRQFKKMYVNSLRVDLPWPQIETAPGVYSWTNSDFLFSKAEELGLRLFVLIGFQYAADWFPTNGYWRGINEEGKPYFIMNYENPEVRQAYSNYIYQVTARYKDRPAVGAWILGNEYSYFDLWNETNKLYFGYDPISLESFRSYLTATYTNRISALNANWGTAYAGFDQVAMPSTYPASRLDPRYYDLIQWRKNSIGELVAVGAVAARKADTNHLLTYSMIGGIFSGDDNKYTCEDDKVIVAHCAAAGAPLDFWSVNNYAYTAEGAEMRSADFGVAKYQESTGLPVLVTETGHSSTDDLYPEEQMRHAKALPTQLWEALMSGAMGVHVFTWNDRHVFGKTFFPRERGFGIVGQDRTLKQPVYWNVLETFRRMENLNLKELLGGSTNPPADIGFFWSRNADMVWPRANQENAMLWGALRRLGYQLGIIDDEKFAAGAAAAVRALVLSRCWLMDPAQLDAVATNVIPSRVHVFANADFPGQLNCYQKPNANYAMWMRSLFGLEVAAAFPGLDQCATFTGDYRGRVDFSGVANLGGLTNGYVDHLGTWKIWHGVQANSGTTVVTHRGNNLSQPPAPALQIKDLITAKTAVTTFALGDSYSGEDPQVTAPEHQWDLRYTWLKAICGDWFGLHPVIELSGPGASHVLPDYRRCSNGSVLIGLLNESTNDATVTLSAPTLLTGTTVENLTGGGILEMASDGVVNLAMAGDDYALLYAYSSGAPSLLSPTANKLWIHWAPQTVYPNGSNWTVVVGTDVSDENVSLAVSLERVAEPNIGYAKTNYGLVTGKGIVPVALQVPDPDPNDPWYISSLSGGNYVFHAWLNRNGTSIADSYLPVRLFWGVHPVGLPNVVSPGATCQVTLGWEDLPSYLPEEAPLPLDHAAVWVPYKASRQYYRVVLELRSVGQVVATQEHLTNVGTGEHTFSIAVPSNASGPFTWSAYLQAAPGTSVDFVDSFEDRDGGNRNDGPVYAPWVCYSYAESNNAALLDQGVGLAASEGLKGVFMVVTNPPNPGAFSGFGMQYNYPQTFALPRDRSQWTNYSFSFDFKEASNLPCVLELQVKDSKQPPYQGQIHFVRTNMPGADGWSRMQASLDQFDIPPWVGSFDSENASALVLNVQMMKPGAMYLGFLDNVRFIGPKNATKIVAPNELWDSFDDRIPGKGDSLLVPWARYAYPSPPPTVGAPTELDRGIAVAQGIDVGQALFLVVSNSTKAAEFSGFGLYYGFPARWSLPADRSKWKNYRLTFAFREANRLQCSLEMQLKSGLGDWIQFTNTYTPDVNGWSILNASLDQFTQVGAFNPNDVQGIALNIRMLEKGVTYTAYFDNVYFETPAQEIPASGDVFGYYQSGDDSSAQDESFRIQTAHREPSGFVQLSWLARSNRSYSVEYQDESLGGVFELHPVLTNLNLSADGTLHVTDTNAPDSEARFYRVRAQKRGL